MTSSTPAPFTFAAPPPTSVRDADADMDDDMTFDMERTERPEARESERACARDETREETGALGIQAGCARGE